MVYIWSDQESVDELKHKLLCTNFELESAKMMAKEEVSKNEEIIKQLFELLKAACQERDEARNQLQKLMNELLPSIPADQTTHILSSQPNNENPIPQKTTNPSMLKESEALLPQTYNFHVYGSYPTNCNLGSLSFQGLPNANFADSSNLALPKRPVAQECGSKFDCASVLIDNIARLRPLPKKGRLMQAVMDTGPLLQTLLVAPLPKWKNPPTLIYGGDHYGSLIEQRLEAVESICPTQSSSSGSASFLESSPGFSQIPSSSVLNFARGSACLNNGLQLHVGNNTDAMQYQIATGKRRRF
ncbi:uncharacterized protein LOC18774660 [Prunus persica]|uniref:uncharacterized protein LOC18774660 n=1 Tax=Prunus persica TaxID=3760 RepID=UPI0009ABA906|nr:uncharacterized protein LOC18774660 [Prunus persica]